MSDTGDTIIVVESPEPETVETPTEVVVTVAEDHDVDFAERITRLEMRVNDVESKLFSAEFAAMEAQQTADTAVAIADAAVETAIEVAAVTEEVVEEVVEEEEPEPSPREKPKSKQSLFSKWWG